MADNEGIFPLFSEDESDIRERMDADANFGIEPTSDMFIDVRPGGFYYDTTQPMVIEFGRLWDSLNETVAASNILTAWGEYLANWALVLGLEREAAVQATGTVKFTGTAATLVGAGTIVGAVQTDPDVEPPEYETIESGTISSELTTPETPSCVTSTTEGTLAAATYFYKITAINAIGETIASGEKSQVTTGATSKNTLDWADVPNATGYKVYRSTTTGTEKFLASVVASAYVDTGAATPTAVSPPVANTTAGGLFVKVRAIESGSNGNIGVGGVSEIVTAVAGVESVTNLLPITGGQDIEDDEELRFRVLLKLRGGGVGNQADYESWALEHPSVGRVTVFPVYEGVAGQVGVAITDVNGDPVSESVVDSLQDELCPLPGQGAGKAPIGDTAIVWTPSNKNIEVIAVYSFESGYNLDGTEGAVALRSSLVQALEDYINQLAAGQTVVYRHALAQNFKVRGIKDVTTFKLNGAEASITVLNSEVPQLKLPPTLS